MALRSTLRRKRKAAQRQDVEFREARNSLWLRLVVWPFFRALPTSAVLLIPIIFTRAKGRSGQELFDIFTIGFILIWVIMAFLSMLTLASEKKWLRHR